MGESNSLFWSTQKYEVVPPTSPQRHPQPHLYPETRTV